MGLVLFQPGDAGGGLEKLLLVTLQHIGQLVMLFAGLLQPGLALAHAEHVFLDGNFQLAHPAFLMRLLGTQGAPTQQRQLAFEAILLLFEFLIAFGGFGLAFEALQLLVQLVADVVQSLQVLLGPAHAVFGFPATLLVLGDTGSLFEGGTQVVGARFDEPRNHALADDGVRTRAEAGPHEQVGDVPAAALLAVEEVVGLPVSGDQTLDGNFSVLGIDTAHAAVAVVELEFDRGLPDGLAPRRAVEDDVGHGFAAQGFGRRLAHDPAHGVDDIGLATAVGPHDGGHVAIEGDGDRIDKGLEPDKTNGG